MRRADRRQSGFTVLEMMIVLAIAGLIIMFVLMAIPALQRNSANSQKRHDVAAILEAVSRWELNHSGTIPYSPADNDYLRYTDLSYYNKNITYNSTGADVISVNPQDRGSAADDESNTHLDAVHIYNRRKCSTTSPGHATKTAAGYNDVVALFAIETAGGPAPQCQQL